MAPRTRKPKEITAPIQTYSLPITYVVSVVEMCKANKIKYFKSPELELHFNDDIEQPPVSMATEKADKEAYKEQVLGDLLLENPLAYEEALNREE